MADFKFEPRVWETTTSTGTGFLALSGAATVETGLRTFIDAGFNTTTAVRLLYVIRHRTLDEWEFGQGRAGTTITREHVHRSSNANALVNFSAGTKDVFLINFLGFSSMAEITADATLDIEYELVYVNSSSARTITLPDAGNHYGKVYTILKFGTGDVTVTRSGFDIIHHPIYGAVTSLLITTRYSGITLASNGSNWVAVADPTPNDFLSPITSPEVAITAAATLTSTAFGKMHVISGTTADYTITLPAVSGNAGKIIGFRVSSAGTRLYTLDGNASETIDGSLTRIIWANETVTLYCTGSEWTKISGKSIPMACILKRTTAQSIANTVWTQIVMTSLVSDSTSGLSVSLGNITSGRAVILRPGKYIAQGFASIETVTAGSEFNGGVGKNSASPGNNPNSFTTVSVPSSGFAHASGSAYFDCVAGDWIGAICYHNHGAARNTRAASTVQPSLSVVEVPSW